MENELVGFPKEADRFILDFMQTDYGDHDVLFKKQ